MKNKLLLLIIFVFSFSFVSQATHVVGGSLTYEQLGGSTYRITLKLYRDCKPGSAAFPGSVVIQIRRDNGTLPPVSSVTIPFPGASSPRQPTKEVHYRRSRAALSDALACRARWSAQRHFVAIIVTANRTTRLARQEQRENAMNEFATLLAELLFVVEVIRGQPHV